MTFQERKTSWLGHGQHLADVALEIIGQCDKLDTTKGARDPKVIALALLSRSLGHFKATCHLLEIGLIVEARTLTRCIFENLFVQGGLAEGGDEFVRKMVDDAAKSRKSRGTWVLGWLDEQEGKSPYEEGLRETMDKLRALYPKPRAINFAEITNDSSLKNAYLWYKHLSSDAAHPSLEALARHIAKEADGSLLVSVELVASEKDNHRHLVPIEHDMHVVLHSRCVRWIGPVAPPLLEGDRPSSLNNVCSVKRRVCVIRAVESEHLHRVVVARGAPFAEQPPNRFDERFNRDDAPCAQLA